MGTTRATKTIQCKSKARSGNRCKNQSVDISGFCRTHHPNVIARASTGNDFEEKVMKTLRLLGYIVERNKTINGCQIDIFAEFVTGIISHTIMVECKDYSFNRTVGIEEINKFAGILHSPRSCGVVGKGLFVTTVGFTREAKEFAESVGIELITFTDLSTKLVDFSGYINKVIAEFENSPVYNSYVDLSGTEMEDFEGEEENIFHRPLDNLVNHYIFDKGHNKLALLGNFGTGKTTFCRKFAYELAKKYKKNSTYRVPIVVNLSDYESKLDIQQLITNTFQFRYGVRIDITICQELQRLGKFLILFDGFDEMATRVDTDIIQDNLRDIDKISRISENKFILTCRTHFFRDSVQTSILSDFDIVYIPEWGEPELSEYLKKRLGEKWKRRLKQINRTHNLSELAQTPLFLEMIVDSLSSLGDNVSPGKLYNVYTNKWIDEQSRRRGARLNKEERRQFVHDLALKLYIDNKSSCHYSEFTDLINKRFRVNDAAKMDYLQSDVRNCTFLTRNTNGDYRFRHKSFMEFFVAEILAKQIIEGSYKNLQHKIIPSEIRRFLLERLSSNPPIQIMKQWLQSVQEEALRGNILTLLTRLNADLSEFKLNDSDEETRIVIDFIQGDPDAFDTLFRRYYTPLKKFIHMRCYYPKKELIEEIALETFMQAWVKKDQFYFGKAKFRLWLFMLANNKISDLLKKNRKYNEKVKHSLNSEGVVHDNSHPDLSIQIADSRSTSESEFQEKLLMEAIERLSDKEQIVIKGRYLENTKASVIAIELGVSLNAVYIIAKRAKDKIRKYLIQVGYE